MNYEYAQVTARSSGCIMYHLSPQVREIRQLSLCFIFRISGSSVCFISGNPSAREICVMCHFPFSLSAVPTSGTVAAVSGSSGTGRGLGRKISGTARAKAQRSSEEHQAGLTLDRRAALHRSRPPYRKHSPPVAPAGRHLST